MNIKKWKFESFGYDHHVEELSHDDDFMYPREIRLLVREFQQRQNDDDVEQYYDVERNGERRLRIGFKSGTGNTLCIYLEKKQAVFYLTS